MYLAFHLDCSPVASIYRPKFAVHVTTGVAYSYKARLSVFNKHANKSIKK